MSVDSSLFFITGTTQLSVVVWARCLHFLPLTRRPEIAPPARRRPGGSGAPLLVTRGHLWLARCRSACRRAAGRRRSCTADSHRSVGGRHRLLNPARSVGRADGRAGRETDGAREQGSSWSGEGGRNGLGFRRGGSRTTEERSRGRRRWGRRLVGDVE